MASKYYSPVILEKFNARHLRRHQKRFHRRRQSVIPIDGPSNQLAVGNHVISGDIAVFENQDANSVLLDADSQLKSGYPTLAASSMVAKRNRVSVVPEVGDNEADMRFFSELVKPLQYRWRFQKDKLKTLAPSKHGFHQRSQSPTFQRLVEANEKLHDIAGQESDETSNIFKGDFIETQSELNGYLSGVKVNKIDRHAKSEPTSYKNSYASSLPATSDNVNRRDKDLKPEIRNIDSPKKEKGGVSMKDKEEKTRSHHPSKLTPPKNLHSKLTPPPPPPALANSQPHEIKVDFKKHDSHSELHLFLPHIVDHTSRGATPEDQHRKHKVSLELPPIEDTMEVKNNDDDKNKHKKKTLLMKQDIKKKKKLTRIKSCKDDKEIKDILNDVPTLISLETDKAYHPESMCVFENCSLHRHRKSTRIRQA